MLSVNSASSPLLANEDADSQQQEQQQQQQQRQLDVMDDDSKADQNEDNEDNDKEQGDEEKAGKKMSCSCSLENIWTLPEQLWTRFTVVAKPHAAVVWGILSMAMAAFGVLALSLEVYSLMLTSWAFPVFAAWKAYSSQFRRRLASLFVAVSMLAVALFFVYDDQKLKEISNLAEISMLVLLFGFVSSGSFMLFRDHSRYFEEANEKSIWISFRKSASKIILVLVVFVLTPVTLWATSTGQGAVEYATTTAMVDYGAFVFVTLLFAVYSYALANTTKHNISGQQFILLMCYQAAVIVLLSIPFMYHPNKVSTELTRSNDATFVSLPNAVGSCFLLRNFVLQTPIAAAPISCTSGTLTLYGTTPLSPTGCQALQTIELAPLVSGFPVDDQLRLFPINWQPPPLPSFTISSTNFSISYPNGTAIFFNNNNTAPVSAISWCSQLMSCSTPCSPCDWTGSSLSASIVEQQCVGIRVLEKSYFEKLSDIGGVFGVVAALLGAIGILNSIFVSRTFSDFYKRVITKRTAPLYL